MCSLPSLPPFSPLPGLFWGQEMYHNYLWLLSTSTLPLTVAEGKKTAERGGKEAKPESFPNWKIYFTSTSIWASQLLLHSSKSPSPGLLQQPVSLIFLLLILPCLVHPPYSCQSNLSEKHIWAYYFSDKIFQGFTLMRTTRKRSSHAALHLQFHLFKIYV